MQDGSTRKLSPPEPAPRSSPFLELNRASLVIVDGPAAGNEYLLDRTRLDMGRRADLELPFDDDAMSLEHAAFELIEGGFRVRDLGSTNGVLRNGSPVLAAELEHGDRLQIGAHVFQYVVEKLEPGPRTYLLPED